MPENVYFSGQGIVYAADRDTNGNVSKWRDLGNVSKLQLQLATQTTEHKESRTGQRLVDYRLITEKSGKISMTMETLNKENLKMLLYGTSTNLTGASVTAEVLPTSLVVGDIVNLLYPNVSTVSITDSAATPAPLVAGTHYTIDSASGLITILNVGSFTQPFKVNYTYASAEVVQLFKASTKEIWLKFKGLNTANGDKPVIVDLYRVLLDPIGNLDLINDALAQFEVQGSALFDATRNLDANLGGFGRVLQSAF